MNQKTAKFLGSGYFLLLGVINLLATLIWSEIRLLDVIILAVCILPILISKKIFLLTFGVVAALIAAYCMFVCLIFSLDQSVETSRISFLMGFLLTGSALASSVLLIFAGYAELKVNASLLSKA